MLKNKHIQKKLVDQKNKILVFKISSIINILKNFFHERSLKNTLTKDRSSISLEDQLFGLYSCVSKL